MRGVIWDFKFGSIKFGPWSVRMLSSKPVATRKLAKLYDDIRKEGHKSNDSNGFYVVCWFWL